VFTGLIEHTGKVTAVDKNDQGAVVRIASPLTEQLAHGDSIAVNGVCLTATGFSGDAFSADVMHESLDRSSLGALEIGADVNLELPLAVGDRLDGHIVQGHVDGLGEVESTTESGFARVIRVKTPGDLAKYVVEKGSIAIDGVSLTVSDVGDNWLEVSLIPETLERTTLGNLKAGQHVNLEADVLAKHVERLLQHK
jgi:riboflavin synthase